SRPLTRRKSSGDRFDRTSNSSGNVPIIFDYPQGELPTTNDNLLLHPASHLLTIHGCCRSGAAQLLTDRWVTAIHSYNDPSIDLSERPIMYSGATASAWGHSKLSHQMDFLTELRRAIGSANASLGSQ
ncbi:phosphatase 2C, partial [Thalictrum thalictroides]